MSLEILDYIDKINIHFEKEQDLTELMKEIEQGFSAEQISNLLESFPIKLRILVWKLIGEETQQNVFIAMKNESRQLLLYALDDVDCFPLFTKLDAFNLLELSENLNDRFIDFAVSNMTAKQRSLYKKSCDYALIEVGHWQNFTEIQIPQRLKLSAVKKVCAKSLPAFTDVVYVVNDVGALVGEIALNSLLKLTSDEEYRALITPSAEVINSTDNINVACEKVIASAKSALPVIDENNCLTGRLDLPTAYKYKEQVVESQLIQSAGLVEEEDLFSNVWLSSKNRAVWLGINLVTAFLASWFIGLFEATIQQVVALAVLMPVVASMGGISGSQTITLIIRGLALGQITDANKKDIVIKELKVGAINGVLWAVVIGLITYLWFDTFLLSVTIFIAILGNIVIASLSGVWVPWILTKFKIDPALSGSVVLTTVTDIFGFIVFLGLGSVLLL
ncbi:magnesium transporter [Psychromonas sp. psych-6C06]|uniref:magnesium transporter n=1 Tax=Psychromonas sp. psych-6C06 TaxID=2058089 RepID=UPI000C337687|nr:magnesium transporter [Psychromonas sp. psych-6C06]PKF63787.1 magnesium transporter [Psychromonas sp. psych-6C06]